MTPPSPTLLYLSSRTELPDTPGEEIWTKHGHRTLAWGTGCDTPTSLSHPMTPNKVPSVDPTPCGTVRNGGIAVHGWCRPHHHLTFLVAQLLALGSPPGLDFVSVGVDCLVDSVHHLLLPAFRDHQGEVPVQLLVTVKQLLVWGHQTFRTQSGPKGSRAPPITVTCRTVLRA